MLYSRPGLVSRASTGGPESVKGSHLQATFSSRRKSTFVIFADVSHTFFSGFCKLRINITDLGFNFSRWDHKVPRRLFLIYYRTEDTWLLFTLKAEKKLNAKVERTEPLAASST